jgi:hypothetical protein
MNRFILGLVLHVGLSFSPHAAEPQAPQSNFTPLMHMKLDKSKAILEGLTLEDFAKIKANANNLRLLSNEAGWNVIQTREYAEQSRDFQRATEMLADAATEKDIHRASIGYLTLTMRCIECHSYMRKHRIASEQRNSP